jgi:2-phosphosulfolactate phosphatase
MTNHIDVFSSARSFQEEDLRGKTAVIIDVLRATSTITAAINNGAKGVIAVADMSDASKIAQNLDPSRYLLCGEKDGVKIEGYHLGNSPLEYNRDMVDGKTLILNTTNGTKAISRSSLALNIMIASFLNLSAVVNQLKEIDNDIVLVCAGWRNRLSLEDMLCAGQIIHELNDGSLPEHALDGARVAHCLYEKYGPQMPGVIKESNHAVRLSGIVDGNDVDFCSQVDKFDIVPTLEDGIIS